MGSFISSLRWERGGVRVSHHLFVDKSLIFCDACQKQIMYLNWIFMWFEAVSWLKINLEKSELVLVGVGPNKEFASLSGCREGEFHLLLFGSSIASFKARAVWDVVE